MISIIAAMDEKRGIGKNNRIPWHIKEDLVKLRNLTKDHLVILGRKTYESMDGYYNNSGRPMPGELYIVITRDKNYKPTRENATTVNSLEEALEKAKDEGESFIIGGAQIFEQAMPFVDRLYLTIVEGNFDCDTFFPEYSKFKIISEEEGEPGEYRYKFVTLAR